MRDYYKILGLPLNATPSAIKAAYHDLAREHHPDVADRGTHSDQLIRDINQAYSVLGDPKLRRAYDTGRRHTAKDRDNRTHRVRNVVAAAAAVTVCFGLAFVYAFDRDWSFGEQQQSTSRRSDNSNRIQKAGSEKLSERSPRQTQQPEQQVAEWRLAAKDPTQANPRSPTLPTNELEVSDRESETGNSDPQSVRLPDTGRQSRRRAPKTSQAGVKDQVDGLTTQDVALWDSRVHEAIGKPPAVRKEMAEAPARETSAPREMLGPTKPARRQRRQPRIGQSWSKSWKLVAKRWSPRFRVRHFRIDLEKDCASCKWVKFAALRHDVRIHEARIHYSDGTSRKLDVSGTIEDGHATAPQKLGVRFAKFSFISVTHQSRFNLKSGGWLAVYGIGDLGTEEEHQMVSRSH